MAFLRLAAVESATAADKSELAERPSARRAASSRSSGKSDVAAQTAQTFRNLEVALAAAGATLENVIRRNVYVVEDQPLEPAFEVFERVWGRRPNPPLNTLAVVSALTSPDFLVELDAVAVVPE